MPSYSLEIKPSAQKELDALDDTLFIRIDRKILALADAPQDYWRFRVGDYRIIYAIDDTAKTIHVTRIAHRREVYEL